MRLFLPALCAVALLSACGTPTQTTAVINAGVTLASVAAANNSTASKLVQDGQALCGTAVSPSGVLIGGSIVALANDAQWTGPLSVVGAAEADVANACRAIGLIPGALPTGVDPAALPVVPVAGVGLGVTT